jgi:hypothetical protein
MLHKIQGTVLRICIFSWITFMENDEKTHLSSHTWFNTCTHSTMVKAILFNELIDARIFMAKWLTLPFLVGTLRAEI